MDRLHRRRRNIVNGKFEIALAFRLVGYVYVYLTLFALLANSSAILTVVFGSEDVAKYVAAVERLRIFVQVFVLPLALTFVVMCVHGVFLTHSVAGPIHRIRSTLRQLRQKVLPAHLSLRKRDCFQDLCEEMNAHLSGLRAEVLEMRQLSETLAAEAEALDRSGGLPPGAEKILVNLGNGFTRLRQLVNGYRLEDEPEAHAPEGKTADPVPTSC